MNRQVTKHAWHDLLDALDRHADVLRLAALVAVLFAVVAMCAGTADDGRGYLTDATSASPSLADVGTAPGSPAPLTAGSQPGATDDGGAG